MKNKYTSPEIEVVDLEVEDVINASSTGEQDNNSGDMDDFE